MLHCAGAFFRDLAHEAEAFAGDCADQVLRLTVVANCLAHRIDMAGHG